MRKFSGDNRSDRRKDFSKRGSRDSERPSMHKTTCNNCGKDCEVPFKPTSGKPIYCSSCFEKNQDGGQKKYGNERGDRRFKSGDTRKRSFEYDKEKDTDQLKKEIGLLNKKLDKILEILTPDPSVKTYQEKLEEETEEPKIKKKTKKKAVIKKE
jgi:CxxC-x17-CxxC domain-containing protein